MPPMTVELPSNVDVKLSSEVAVVEHVDELGAILDVRLPTLVYTGVSRPLRLSACG